MKLRLPPMPKLPWTAKQWAARKVSDLQEAPDFITYCASWVGDANGADESLYKEVCDRAEIRRLTIENIAHLHREAEALVVEHGGKTGAAPFAFHLHLALMPPYCRLLISKGMSAAHRPIVAGFIERTSRAAQRAALVAISQRLKCAPGGLIGWRTAGSS